MTKKWYRSKTFWWGVFQEALALSVWIGSMPGLPKSVAALFGASGIVTLILRAVTNSAVTL